MKRGLLHRLGNGLLLLLALGLAIFLVVLPLSWQEQAFVGLASIAILIVLNRLSHSQTVTITMMALSGIATTRYAVFRVQQTIEGMTSSGHAGTVSNFFVIILLLAELYAFMTLYLGHFQTLRPLRRRPVPMPDDTTQWPSVDVFVPTFNEPLYVVRPTVLAALNMDWPADKIHVYLLDDGTRPEFRAFAESVGSGYIIRDKHDHAKAGNINHAMTKTASEYIAIFDCDHIPTRSFLQITIGWFLKDKRLGMLQTPHHFYSPDPFEKNLSQFRKMPNEGELFYGIVQDGNDFWNATFFCGSCAVLRRSALEEIGGVAVETVTEDCHTALRMQQRKWNTAYINIPQAAGLATENLSSHIGQRIRWARGMVQILRLENPLFCHQLSWPQRLCYFNACSHFLYSVPRLVFLTAPLVYLLFGWVNIYGYAWALLAYALPHILLAQMTNSRVQGHYRLSFWNEIYEAVLAPYILMPTLLALINPRLGKFNVTAKGGLVSRSYFDGKIALPFLILLGMNVVGLALGVPRYMYWDATHRDTVLMNLLWTFYNVVILTVSAAVAWETKQLRRFVRVDLEVPVTLVCQEGTQIPGTTINMSNCGLALRVKQWPRPLQADEPLNLFFPERGEGCFFHPKIVSVHEDVARLDFGDLNLEQEEVLTRVLYSRADSWLDWGEHREEDRPLRTYARLLTVAAHGVAAISRGLLSLRDSTMETETKAKQKKKSIPVLALALIVALAILLLVYRSPAESVAVGPTAASGEFHDTLNLQALGVSRAILLRGGSRAFINFGLPVTKVVAASRLSLRYSAPPEVRSGELTLQLMLNGTAVASENLEAGTNRLLEFVLPAELLTTENSLSLQLTGHCAACSQDAPWAVIGVHSELTLSGARLPIANELRLLPQPFFDRTAQRLWSLPFVLPTVADSQLLQAASVVASRFGDLSDYRGVQFSVSRDTLSSGNAVIVATLDSPLVARFDLKGISGPTIAMRTNPVDPYGKVLLIVGNNSAQVLTAARAFATDAFSRNGDTALLSVDQKFLAAAPYGAPRWHSHERPSGLGEYTAQDNLRVYGSGSVDLFFRLPPDLYFVGKTDVPVILKYQYGGVGKEAKAYLAIRLNGAFVGVIPLKPEGAGVVHRDRVMLPVRSLNAFNNVLTADFMFGGPSLPANPQYGQLMRETQLELNGVRHSLAMPKLELFAQAGYPFTVYSDLSRTAVVMPATPTNAELELLLDMMAFFGATTGSPSTLVTVATPADRALLADRDLVVIGSSLDQPLVSEWTQQMPIEVQEAGGRLGAEASWFERMQPDSPIRSADRQLAAGMLAQNDSIDGYVEQFESPLSPGRSVVMLIPRDSANTSVLASMFVPSLRQGKIYGTVAIAQNGTFQSFHIARNMYRAGRLNAIDFMMLTLTRYYWLMPLLMLLCALVVGVLLNRVVEHHAWERLNPGTTR